MCNLTTFFIFFPDVLFNSGVLSEVEVIMFKVGCLHANDIHLVYLVILLDNHFLIDDVIFFWALCLKQVITFGGETDGVYGRHIVELEFNGTEVSRVLLFGLVFDDGDVVEVDAGYDGDVVHISTVGVTDVTVLLCFSLLWWGRGGVDLGHWWILVFVRIAKVEDLCEG